jgi:hypothetical protein
MQGRQHEGGGLAGTGLRGNHQVATGDRCGNGLLLDGGRFVVAGVGQCFEDGRMKTDFCKRHVLFRVGMPRTAGTAWRAAKAIRATPTNEKLRDRLCSSNRNQHQSAQKLCARTALIESTPEGRRA